MAEFLLARLRKKYQRREPIVSITAYDYFTALIALEAGVDFVLVGDSLGNVIQGVDTTVPVTLDQVIYHTRIVCRHFPAGRVVLDMPFGTFKLSANETVKNCVRAFQETGCGAVKFEGATNENLFAVRTLSEAGVPVLGHLGLLPQRVHSEGGYHLQGKTASQAEELLREAAALAGAGVFAIVVECVVPEVAARITDAINVPTIGIGSGSGVSGQIIVVHDILGMLPGKPPKFVKQYANIFDQAAAAVRAYAGDVQAGRFPEAGKTDEPHGVYSGERRGNGAGDAPAPGV